MTAAYLKAIVLRLVDGSNGQQQQLTDLGVIDTFVPKYLLRRVTVEGRPLLAWRWCHSRS